MILIPSVSIGNVPQLAVDLIIHTYGFQLVKSLDDEFLTPFVGPMDYAEGSENPQGIATAAQLFRSGEIYIVQLRSPPLMGKKQKFVKNLLQQLCDDGVPTDEVVLVGSANAGMSEQAQTNRITRVRGSDRDSTIVFPESGFLNEALYEVANYTAVVTWVHEGNNFADAAILAQEIVSDMKLTAREFKPPVSWARVYGKDVPLDLEQGIYS